MALRVTADGSVVVRAPLWVPLREVDAFVAQRAAWIEERRTQVAQALPSVALHGAEVRLAGALYRVETYERPGPRLRIEERDGTLRLGLPAGCAEADGWRALKLFLRRRAEITLPPVVERWAAVMDVDCRGVLIRDQRTRWGSCSSDGTIRLNWRVLLLEPELIDLVVVHELAHVTELNHSARFWARVEAFLPDCRATRRALRMTRGELLRELSEG